MRCADADAQVRSPTLLPSNRHRRHNHCGAGVESETPPPPPRWTRTLLMPHPQSGWALLRSAARFWRPLVGGPRTWTQKAGPGWRGQLTRVPTVRLSWRRGGRGALAGASLRGGDLILGEGLSPGVGVQLGWRVQPGAGDSSWGCVSAGLGAQSGL